MIALSNSLILSLYNNSTVCQNRLINPFKSKAVQKQILFAAYQFDSWAIINKFCLTVELIQPFYYNFMCWTTIKHLMD